MTFKSTVSADEVEIVDQEDDETEIGARWDPQPETVLSGAELAPDGSSTTAKTVAKAVPIEGHIVVRRPAAKQVRAGLRPGLRVGLAR